jgi:hypothetical protein
MHSASVVVQSGAQISKTTSQSRLTHPGSPQAQGLAEVIQKRTFVRLVAVQLKAHGPKAKIAQPSMDNLKCCHFFRHKQDLLASVGGARNKVSDGLRFPRSGRPLDQEVAPATDFLDGSDLRRVGIEDMDRIQWRQEIVKALVLGNARRFISKTVQQHRPNEWLLVQFGTLRPVGRIQIAIHE